jgi:hypothetical protein
MKKFSMNDFVYFKLTGTGYRTWLVYINQFRADTGADVAMHDFMLDGFDDIYVLDFCAFLTIFGGEEYVGSPELPAYDLSFEKPIKETTRKRGKE